MEADIIISNAIIIPMTKRGLVLRRHSIVICDGVIKAIGPSSRIDYEYKAPIRINAKGYAALPGFINTHTHLYQTLIRGTIDTEELISWNNRVLVPLARALMEYRLNKGYEIDYYYTMLSIIEMIRCGITTFNCLDAITPGIPRAIGDSGVRGVYTPVLVDRWLPKDLLPPLEEQIRACRRLIEEFRGKYGGRLRFMIGPTTVFTSSEKLLKEALRLSREYGIGIHMHVNETRFEVEWAKRNLGMTVIEYLDSLGLISRRFLAVHCVWCTDKELEILKDRGASVSYNPESNMKLASGIAPVSKMIKMGINVALGTDGPASNDNLDMIETIRITALLHKVITMNPKALTAWDVLEMATINGARALGMEDLIGTIEVGKRADIVLIDLRDVHTQPLHDIAQAVVYSARSSDIDTVIIDGRLIMRRRKILAFDAKKIARKAIKIGRRILRKAGFRIMCLSLP